MPYHFLFTEWFDRNLKFLRKHNPSLRAEFEAFLHDFDAEAHPVIPGTGGARKARMKAKARGKRSGYRVIYYFVTALPNYFHPARYLRRITFNTRGIACVYSQ